jgi:hypothetical protein
MKIKFGTFSFLCFNSSKLVIWKKKNFFSALKISAVYLLHDISVNDKKGIELAILLDIKDVFVHLDNN